MYAANTNSVSIAHIYECYRMIIATQFVAPLVCVVVVVVVVDFIILLGESQQAVPFYREP